MKAKWRPKDSERDVRIYIESNVPSYVAARPARDLLQAARQKLTKDWWRLKRHRHELFTSQVTLDEIAGGERAMAQRRLEIMADTPVLELTSAAASLTEDVLASGLLPATADSDAAHIALATVHKMDILLTWNCRHIANAAIQVRLRRVVQSLGYELPAICTPDELSGELYE
jgi:hypothetical protein